MKHVAVLLDGTAGEEVALSWARLAAARSGAELSVTKVGDPVPHTLADPNATADLIVVYRGAEHWYPAVHVDHPLHRLVADLAQPIAVVPAGAPDPGGPLVIGVDGSPGAEAAVRWVRCAGAALPDELLAAYVRPVASSRVLAHGAPAPARMQSSWVTSLEDTRLEVAGVEVEGDPVEELCRLAAGRPNGMLAVGGRVRSGTGGLAIGTVGLRLLERAAVPVVVVPPTYAPSEVAAGAVRGSGAPVS